MVEAEPVRAASADLPLTDAREDRLGYAPFAKHVTRSILDTDRAAGFVIGVYAPWGCGRTTFLRFVRDYMAGDSAAAGLRILELDPCWTAAPGDLASRFLGRLQTAIADRAPVLSHNPASPDWQDPGTLKRSLEDRLRREGARLLVIMDNVDRLDALEISQLFRLIKGVADLPGVIYLMAFDRDTVLRMLAETQPHLPEMRLDELIQVAFVLPAPDKTSLRRILDERLEDLLGNTSDELFHPEYWRSVYLEGVDHFIQGPRDMIRLVNTLSLTYPPMRHEVNFVDYVAMEALRLFFPSVHDLIRKNPAEFTGQPGGADSSGLRGENRNAFHDAWMRQVPEEAREALQHLLISVFPKLRLVWRGVYYAMPWESQVARRIADCSPEAVGAYFRFAVPEGSISNVEMRALVTLSRESAAFSTKLVELSRQPRPDGSTRLRAFLERFLDYARVEEISLDQVPCILDALFDVGDQILSPETRPGRIYTADNLLIRRIVLHLLRGLPETDSFQMLKRSLQRGAAVGTIVDVISNVDWQHGRFLAESGKFSRYAPAPGSNLDRLLSPKHVDELQKLAVARIQAAAQEGKLAEVPTLDELIRNWRAWGGEQEALDWIRAHRQEPEATGEVSPVNITSPPLP